MRARSAALDRARTHESLDAARWAVLGNELVGGAAMLFGAIACSVTMPDVPVGLADWGWAALWALFCLGGATQSGAALVLGQALRRRSPHRRAVLAAVSLCAALPAALASTTLMLALREPPSPNRFIIYYVAERLFEPLALLVPTALALVIACRAWWLSRAAA